MNEDEGKYKENERKLKKIIENTMKILKSIKANSRQTNESNIIQRNRAAAGSEAAAASMQKQQHDATADAGAALKIQ